MLLEFENATIVDPLHPRNGQRSSLFVRNGRFVEETSNPSHVDRRVDLLGRRVLAGGIDIHTHIGGGKVNLARLLMPCDPRSDRQNALWSTVRTGELYNRMGYTACFEPAMLLSSARHTHLELADTPNLDSGAYVVVGNEEWLLKALGNDCEDGLLDALLGWTVTASRALAIKVVNPGGISAFKFNQRTLDVDQRHVFYGVRPRDVVRRLSAAVQRLNLPHPLHVHASNLGVPGNVQATLATLDAAEGLPIHLAHAQFNCYSSSGPYGMGSGAKQLAEYVNAHPNVSLDVGQIVFGQTVTISADAAAQYRNRIHAKPNRWVVSDIECQAGCGVVPMRYQDRQYVHSLQWTIGLELMLLVDDPWRVFLTTDHPNGGPFTAYPHLLRLLMDAGFRKSVLETIHPKAAQNSLLQEISREYSLDEVAIITRAAPARILGQSDRGTLRAGAIADFAAYQFDDNWENTFANAAYVMKAGTLVIQEGKPTNARAACQTVWADVNFDSQRFANMAAADIEQALLMPVASLEISPQEMSELVRYRSHTTGTGTPVP